MPADIDGGPRLALRAIAGHDGWCAPGKQPRAYSTWWISGQYVNTFGGFIKNGYMPLSVYGFFANGGGNSWVVRVGGDVISQPAVAALPGRAATAIDSLKVTSKLSGADGNDISVDVADEAPAPPEGRPPNLRPPARLP